MDNSMAVDGEKARVLVVAPFPQKLGTYGGVAVVAKSLIEARALSHYNLRPVNLSKGRSLTESGRFSLVNSLFAVYQLGIFTYNLAIFRPNLVHIHTSVGLLPFVKMRLMVKLCRVAGVPVLLSNHGSKLDTFLEKESRFSKHLAARLFRNASRIHLLSEQWRRIVQAHLPEIPGEKIVVIPNPVDAGFFLPVQRDRTGTDVDVIFVGSIGQRKGVFDLLEAFHTLVAEEKQYNLYLHLAGPEEKADELERVRQTIDALGLDENVIEHGMVDHEELRELYQRADIFALPSHAENLPVSLLEAMSSGLPVVISSVGGIPEVLNKSRGGIMIEPEDVKGLAKSLRDLIHSPEKRQRFGQANRELIVAEYSLDTIARQFDCVYQEMIRHTAQSHS
jgi:glycosyltransferase involved in cell wall biosynthesis